MRNIAAKFYQPSPIDDIETETLFDEAMMVEVLGLSSIDEQVQRGKFKLEKLPLDHIMESVIGGFNPALSRNTYKARETYIYLVHAPYAYCQSNFIICNSLHWL